MVDRLVLAVTGKENVAAAWGSLVSAKDIVGIKISATGAGPGATHRAIVTTIVEGLVAAGVPRTHIVVWDREEEDLRAAGYLPGGINPARSLSSAPWNGSNRAGGTTPKPSTPHRSSAN